MPFKFDTRLTFGMCLMAAALLGTGGCKKKNSSDGGLLDDPPQTSPGASAPQATSPTSGEDPAQTALTSPQVAPGGDWKLTCRPSDVPQDPRVYTIEITGAVSETSENQPIKITITKSITTAAAGVKPDNPSPITIATAEGGRGAIAPLGNLFVGFAGGALTGQYQASTKKHEGLLTLVQDQDVSGLGVLCEVQNKTGTP